MRIQTRPDQTYDLYDSDVPLLEGATMEEIQHFVEHGHAECPEWHRMQRLTHEYGVALCDTPSDIDGYGLLRHRECGCPKMLTDWYYEAMGG